MPFHGEFRVIILFLDLRYFYCVDLAQGTKAVPSRHLVTSHCYKFSLEHKTVISTEVFIGIRFGHDAILSLESIFSMESDGTRDIFEN